MSKGMRIVESEHRLSAVCLLFREFLIYHALSLWVIVHRTTRIRNEGVIQQNVIWCDLKI